MEQTYARGLTFIRWLQATYPQLDEPMQLISLFGKTELYILLATLIYWCIHKQHGRTLLYLLLLSVTTNTIFKAFFRLPRPFWFDSSIGLTEELSYGLPSGYTQLIVTFVFFLASLSKWSIGSFFAVIYVVTISFSTIYLGAHFGQDILIGGILGSIVIVGYWSWEHTVSRAFRERIFGQRLSVAILFPLILSIVYVAVMLRLGKPDYTNAQIWSFLRTAEQVGQKDSAMGIASLFGAGIGFLFEMNRIWFNVQGNFINRAIRCFIGLIFTIALWMGMEFLFEVIMPLDMHRVAVVLTFIRYFILTMWITYFAPQLFVATGLAKRMVAPETPYSIKSTRIRPENRFEK